MAVRRLGRGRLGDAGPAAWHWPRVLAVIALSWRVFALMIGLCVLACVVLSPRFASMPRMARFILANRQVVATNSCGVPELGNQC